MVVLGRGSIILRRGDVSSKPRVDPRRRAQDGIATEARRCGLVVEVSLASELVCHPGGEVSRGLELVLRVYLVGFRRDRDGREGRGSGVGQHLDGAVGELSRARLLDVERLERELPSIRRGRARIVVHEPADRIARAVLGAARRAGPLADAVERRAERGRAGGERVENVREVYPVESRSRIEGTLNASSIACETHGDDRLAARRVAF